MNGVLTCEKLKIDEKVLVLCNELDILNDLMNKREETFNTNLSRLESESLNLKFNLESQMSENKQLLEKILKTEINLTENRGWNNSSEALIWLSTHNNRNRKGLGFANRRVTKPMDRKYVGLPEIIRI